MRFHRVDETDLADFASGLGGPRLVQELYAAQLSETLLLLRHVTTVAPARTDAAIAILTEAQARRPDIYRRRLGDPMAAAWAADTARELRKPDPDPIVTDVYLAHLDALAISAAAESGIAAELTVKPQGGRVVFPGVGSVVVGGAWIRAIAVDGRLSVQSDSASIAASAWWPERRLSAGAGDLRSSVTLEDLSPHRHRYHAPAVERMDDEAYEDWQAQFAAAWELIREYLPDRAPELAVGVRSLVPLRSDDSSAARSGTARDAVGAIGLTRPRSPVDLVVTLVHELQHSKLSALLDLVTLYEPHGTERHFAPWRTDPRPTGGLVQGVYAFLGVADAWRALRLAPAHRGVATREYAAVRRQVDVGLTALEKSAELTATGRRLAEGMRSQLDILLKEELPAADEADADALLRRRQEKWQRVKESNRKAGGNL